jgi:hypothetical protein
MHLYLLRSMAVAALVVLITTASQDTLGQSSGRPTAIVDDTSDGGGPGGGTFFVLEAVDGVEVPDTALSASFRASFGRGAYMVVRGAGRPVSAGRVTLKLRGVQTHVAPINSIFRTIFRGGNPEVAGAVAVDLVAGQRYRVSGVLDGFKREVWIEDDRGTELAGSRVAVAPDPELLKQMEGSAFIKTNLRYEGDWINEASLPNRAFVPVGARLKVLDYGSNRASVLIDGRKMRLGIDWTRDKETIQQFVARVTGEEDPRATIATYPERVRNAIRAGRVFPGMTKDQVLVSMGRPRLDLTPTLNEKEWTFEVPEQGELIMVFDEAGLLTEVDGARQARKLVLYEAQ